MNELNKLKKRLLKEGASEADQVYSLCAIMEVVGGYEQLMNLPLPALKAVGDYLDFKAKQEQKSMPKTKR